MILIYDLYKNRELKWNVKAKDTASREMDVGWALINDGYRAGESNAPPEIPAELFADYYHMESNTRAFLLFPLP